MKKQLWGPFQPLPQCRLWLSEDPITSAAEQPERHQQIAEANLCSLDLERWNRYRPAQKKWQFLSSRLAIRAVLQREFGPLSDRYRVETMVTGQPKLTHQGQDSFASISLSHTGSITAIALSKGEQRLGVDIEVVKPLDVCKLSSTFLNQHEHDWLTKEDLSGNVQMIFAIWTLKEAIWKALGGPRDTTMSEIVAEYHNSTLNGQWSTQKGEKQSVSTHFFGHQFSFPIALSNYSSIECLSRQVPSFVGCIAMID